MNYSIIQKSELEGALRLDAEYYNPEFLELKKVLQANKTEKVSELSSFVKKGIFDLSPENYREEGIPFVRVQNIRKGFLNEEGLVFIPEEVHEREKKTELEALDLVLSKVGTVGEISIIPSHSEKANFSQNVVGARIKKEKIYPGYLLVYLLSRFGQLQLERAQMFQVQPKLELQDVRELEIIRLGKIEKEIHESVLEVERLQEESKSLYSQAEGVLLEELGLRDFELNDELYNVVNFSEVQAANRMDAEYFQPKYEKLIAKLKSQKSKLLEELVSMKKGIEPGSEVYEEEGKLFVRVSNITKQGLVDGNQKYISEKLYEKLQEDYQPKEGEILLTKDATPGIAYVLKESIEGVISGGVLRLKLKEDIDPEYLALCISSLVGQMQAERDAGGSIIKHWKPEEIKNVIIPILAKGTQEEIADFVRQSHEARKKAKELLEKAKHQVEQLIENQST